MTVQNEVVLPPPTERYTILGWLKKNLFQNWFSGLVTVVSLVFIYFVLKSVLGWVFTEAKWGIIVANWRLMMIGQYPITAIWRIWVCLGLLALLAGISWNLWIRTRLVETFIMPAAFFILALLPIYDTASRLCLVGVGLTCLLGLGLSKLFPGVMKRFIVYAWMAYFVGAIFLIRGWGADNTPTAMVSTNVWGGLLLTMLIAVVGLVISFPIGVLLAIGRQSKYPVVRSFCVVYIELIRSVPLITVLFMAQTMLPLFLPESLTPDRVVRAMAAFTIFSAAYMAENVRGGLQSIAKGQHEAAAALGLNGFQTMMLIILPQALKSIIPIITASCIGSFRDTSLVLIVGLFDLLGIAKATLAQADFLGRNIEVYTFLAALYWVLSYFMSYVGQQIEKNAGIPTQR